jgi:hypothetical protein
MSEDELKLNRRLFLQHSATAGAAAAWYSVALKTDALADTVQMALISTTNDGILPYVYHEESQP